MKNKESDRSKEIKKLEELVESLSKESKSVSIPKLWDDKAIYVLSKLILELIKSAEKLNTTTSKYSKILIGLTIIMTIAVLVQVGLFFVD